VPHPQDDAPPSRESVQRIVDERGPGTNRLGELRFSATLRVHARIASRFRIGRCLLAGDAAHIMIPAGAQGMNTGGVVRAVDEDGGVGIELDVRYAGERVLASARAELRWR
jgi:hypothetical protein